MHTNKLMALVLTVLLLAGTALAADTIPAREEEMPETEFASGDTLYFWYTDDSLTDYLTNVSALYYNEKGIHVIPVLQTGAEYLEQINDERITLFVLPLRMKRVDSCASRVIAIRNM